MKRMSIWHHTLRAGAVRDEYTALVRFLLNEGKADPNTRHHDAESRGKLPLYKVAR